MDAIDNGQSIRFVLEKDNELLIDRIWIGESVDVLIETARARLPRELSDAERRRFYLPEVEQSGRTRPDNPTA